LCFMKLSFEEITKKTHRYLLDDTSWSPHLSEGFSITASANISVSRRGRETVLLEGKLEGQLVADCDRCGEQVKQELQNKFVYLVTTKEELISELREIECSDEDVITLYLKEPEIDVDEILREQTYLAVPLGNLCSKDCKGICAGCGAALNSESCCCSLDTSSSAFAVLKKLTNR
jgi:uncharacterized protein